MHQSTPDAQGNDDKRPWLWGEGKISLISCLIIVVPRVGLNCIMYSQSSEKNCQMGTLNLLQLVSHDDV